MAATRPVGSAWPGQAEARALSSALKAAGGWTPCEGSEPRSIDPAVCSSCKVRQECGDYGEAVGGVGVFGGVRRRGKSR